LKVSRAIKISARFVAIVTVLALVFGLFTNIQVVGGALAYALGFGGFTILGCYTWIMVLWGLSESRKQTYYYEMQTYESFLAQESVRNLYLEVTKFNSTVKALDIVDRLVELGNVSASLNVRTKVIEALMLTRQDLIRALKTERILRENKDFIISNPSMFDRSLSTIESLRVGNEAGEWIKLFDQAMQVAVEVRSEMRKLQANR